MRRTRPCVALRWPRRWGAAMSIAIGQVTVSSAYRAASSRTRRSSRPGPPRSTMPNACRNAHNPAVHGVWPDGFALVDSDLGTGAPASPHPILAGADQRRADPARLQLSEHSELHEHTCARHLVVRDPTLPDRLPGRHARDHVVRQTCRHASQVRRHALNVAMRASDLQRRTLVGAVVQAFWRSTWTVTYR